MKRLITLFTALLLISFSTMAQTYEVTFVVDMNEVEGDFTTPEVNGSWDGWCGGCTPLSDPDMDGIWTATKTLDAGYYEYKFAYDSWSGDETLTPGTPCTVTTGEFTNRFIDVTEDVVLDEVCYGFCEACDAVTTVPVTFSVNMNDVADPFTTPEVNGSWDGWCGGCTPLSDPDGDGVWTGTRMLEPGYYEYKFAADAWSIDESLTEGDPCTNTTDVFTNRFIEVTEGVELDPVCWASCDICEGVALEQMDLPVTFDEEGVDYGVIGFGGAEASFIVEDPTDPTNTVVEATKSATAMPWAGTTVTNAAEEGFATPIPFTMDDTQMSVRVWSPDAGIQVRLKVEDYTDPTKSVETEATSTVAGDWEVLVFDFANEAAGTAALNLTYDYNKASIFFNFGVDGATAGEKTYYFDDIEFYLGEPVCDIPGDFELTDVTATTASFDWSDIALSDQYVLTVFRADLSARTKIRPTASEGTVTGLEPSTEYGARVKTVCFDEGIRSENTETIFFTTDPLRLGSAGEGISVFPNPSNGLITLSTNDIEAGSMIMVTNLSGQVVYQGTLNSSNQQIDLTNLSDGLYSITVANSSMNRTFQISIIK